MKSKKINQKPYELRAEKLQKSFNRKCGGTKEKIDAGYWFSCKGCRNGHSSFWKTIIESPQWLAWEDEVYERMHEKLGNVWDVDECRECGWISPAHFQDFLKFTANNWKF